VKWDFGNSTSVHCGQCGHDMPELADGEEPIDRTVASVGTTFQVVVACANCGTPFVMLARN